MEPKCTVGNIGTVASILKQAFLDLSSCLYCEVIHSESGTKLQFKNHCWKAGSWNDPRYQDELIPMCMYGSYVTPNWPIKMTEDAERRRRLSKDVSSSDKGHRSWWWALACRSAIICKYAFDSCLLWQKPWASATKLNSVLRILNDYNKHSEVRFRWVSNSLETSFLVFMLEWWQAAKICSPRKRTEISVSLLWCLKINFSILPAATEVLMVLYSMHSLCTGSR